MTLQTLSLMRGGSPSFGIEARDASLPDHTLERLAVLLDRDDRAGCPVALGPKPIRQLKLRSTTDRADPSASNVPGHDIISLLEHLWNTVHSIIKWT